MKHVLPLTLLFAACGEPTPPGQMSEKPPAPATTAESTKSGGKALNGAGASFPYPLLSKWSAVYHDDKGVQINYQSIGSGGGQKAILDKTVAFAGSDAPLPQDKWDLAQADGGIVHVPETLGAVVPVVHLPGVESLRLTGPVLAGIYRGTVTKWNDPAIAGLNPGIALPDHDIVVAHRSDGSGTTYVFTGYLAKVDPEWASAVGRDTSVNWPVGVGGKGNEGVSGVVSGNEDAIGYVELAYAALNHLQMVQLQNHDGNWVSPTMEGVSAAAAAAPDLPAGPASWTAVDITDEPGAQTWPIASFTYLLFYQDMGKAQGKRLSREDAEATLRFAWWAVHDGQQYGPALQYPALPAAVVTLDEQTLKGITWNGEPLLKD